MINESGLDDALVKAEIASLADWVKQLSAPVQARGPKGRFDRDLYSPPPTIVQNRPATELSNAMLGSSKNRRGAEP